MRAPSGGAGGARTVLNPVLGYRQTTELARRALLTGRTVREPARPSRSLSDEQIDVLLDHERVVRPEL
ncbi:hypothetical protein [Streptomyces sp. NPDC039028]|uniref:hypothetical protein n=1 Tax=unclassified Streptomyces TaxID=2593676 RepID=UPI0034012E59